VGGFKDPMQTCRQCKRLFRADQVWEEIKDSEWLKSLGQVMESSVDPQLMKVKSPALLKWAEKPGKRLAPGLALVRNPSVTLSWLVEHLEQHPEENLDIITLLQFLATEQFAQTGLVTPCPACGGDLTEPREFNLMFRTYVGATATEDDVAYLRPETAQGIFVNWPNVLDTQRVKLPFGIAQVGKAFRNEINPRNYTFRSREFEQMEIEFFCRDEEAMAWYEFWRKVRYEWYVNLGLESEKLRLRDQTEDELAHYSKCCADIEYLFPFSDEHQELEGVAHRGCYDLEQHQKHSGKDLAYFDDDLWQQDAHKYKDDKQAAKKAKEGPPYRFLPTVIEPSAGADRTALAFLCEAYTEDEAPDEKGKMQKRVVMKFHPKIAPIKAAFFPLVNKAGMPELAYKLYRDAKQHFTAFYDDKGAIGRRYRRQDEAGTPFCITVDGDTIEKDDKVTIRDRDTLAQERVHKDQVVRWLRERLGR
jgi:glycyl-tRNA synthetase